MLKYVHQSRALTRVLGAAPDSTTHSSLTIHTNKQKHSRQIPLQYKNKHNTSWLLVNQYIVHRYINIISAFIAAQVWHRRLSSQQRCKSLTNSLLLSFLCVYPQFVQFSGELKLMKAIIPVVLTFYCNTLKTNHLEQNRSVQAMSHQTWSISHASLSPYCL